MKPVLERSRPAVSVVDFSREQLIERLCEILGREQLASAWLIGSCARGEAKPWSDIDLILVCETDLPFVERPRLFSSLNVLDVPVDLLVYTPEEFAQLETHPTSFWRQAQKDRLRLI
ncbi:nucleotidyltransferase domain-containing protein [Geoalkalibacter halelectricus]|uniref:Nucleotidyltransferase domain-containing protein n=1 Tax=Geoalkalibacter halelectricus TaxID=2847045 RepID=A0ABY5ZR13_9BACT|nr:nucleotidyltransferase domain-containing protein [Geoalkalibacter halelectricus]MDO3378345.1 nucleotidyltransferase domain-containing protein [Geoalkalibacter halelectricus]UWZ80335.1 nucleotidyltransferase domain-containing protein [Geoalkalibacter halelectricus]